MNDNEAMKETAGLVKSILLLCKKYAEKDGIDFRYVVRTTAEAMLKFAK